MFNLDDYSVAWLVLALCSLSMSVLFCFWFRRVLSVFARIFVSSIILLFLLIPAPIPDYGGFFAPAYTVYIFETFFQIRGSPLMSAQILLLSFSALTVFLFAGRYFFRAKK